MVEWLTLHGKKIVWAFSALLLILFLLFRLYSGNQAKAEKDFLEASKLAPQLFEPKKAAEAVEKLQTFIQRYPSLQAEYDGVMAQSYLNQGEASKAAPLIERSLDRIQSDNLKPYLLNATIALAISEGMLAESYPEALALKENLNNKGASKDKGVLYYFNLLRLGTLEHALGKKEAEKKTWEEFIGASKEPTASFQKFLESIDIPGASVVTFIQERQKNL